MEFIEDYSETKSDPDSFRVKHEDTEEQIAKPGVCPDDKDMIGACVERCFGDRECPDDEKCCSNGCGHVCMPPYKAKPGVCPDDKDMIGACVEDCFGDRECPDDEKCCSNGCGHVCMPPYKAEKPGSCPKPVGFGLCAEMCSGDSSCPNNQKCCSNGCGHVCMPPYKAALSVERVSNPSKVLRIELILERNRTRD
ncbi:hypothetical protein cypCar_00028294 [Cyprinus carpio]|nr:hypothetical protein cypCar_00028294 [Cyprinus carpio]